MRKFRHIPTGKLVEGDSESYVYEDESKTIPSWVVENGKDWEEIKEYPVGTKVKHKLYGDVFEKQADGLWDKVGASPSRLLLDESRIGETFEIVKVGPEFTILSLTDDGLIKSIRRERDGTVFAVGGKWYYEKTKLVTIKSIGKEDWLYYFISEEDGYKYYLFPYTPLKS